MRGFLQAAILGAAVTSAFVVPNGFREPEEGDTTPAVELKETDNTPTAPSSDWTLSTIDDVEVLPSAVESHDETFQILHPSNFGDDSESSRDEEFYLYLETEIEELDWMRRELDQLKDEIHQREKSLARHFGPDVVGSLRVCDSLKCVARTIFHKAKGAVGHLISKISRHHDHHRGHHGGHGNHTHGRGNCSHPFPGRGNHTHHRPAHPPPHWRKPHFRPPPFCHCPPPPPHKGPHPPPGKTPGEGPHHPHENPHRPHHGGRLGDQEPQVLDHDRSASISQLSAEVEYDNGSALPHPPPPHRHHFRPFHVVAGLASGVLLLLLLINLCRRCCCTNRPQRRERKRLRAEKRHAKRQAWRAWFRSNFTRELKDYEEKRAVLQSSGSESNDEDDIMAAEIAQLRNATDMVADIVAAEEGRSHRLSIGSLPSYRSEMVDSEDLPEYEDSDGSEASSIIADGFRYTPTGSERVPGEEPSPEGNVRAVLGDTKDYRIIM